MILNVGEWNGIQWKGRDHSSSSLGETVRLLKEDFFNGKIISFAQTENKHMAMILFNSLLNERATHIFKPVQRKIQRIIKRFTLTWIYKWIQNWLFHIGAGFVPLLDQILCFSIDRNYLQCSLKFEELWNRWKAMKGTEPPYNQNQSDNWEGCALKMHSIHGSTKFSLEWKKYMNQLILS